MQEPVLVRCTAVEHDGTEALRLSVTRDRLMITTPTVYNRTLWTAEQARQLRDALTTMLGHLPTTRGDTR